MCSASYIETSLADNESLLLVLMEGDIQAAWKDEADLTGDGSVSGLLESE